MCIRDRDKVQLLENIKLIQGNNNITPSKELIEGQGKCSLDIEMETLLSHLILHDGSG